jgi:hypothetical protein
LIAARIAETSCRRPARREQEVAELDLALPFCTSSEFDRSTMLPGPWPLITDERLATFRENGFVEGDRF